jgi:hypothetical protein
MMMEWMRNPAVEVAGWVLVHSLGQLAAVGAVVWVVLRAMGRARSNARYAVALFGMGLMVAAPVGTAVWLCSGRVERAGGLGVVSRNDLGE